MTAKKAPNIRQMQEMFEEARCTGNHGAIQKEMALACGVTKESFDDYRKAVERLYAAATDYVFLKNGYDATDE